MGQLRWLTAAETHRGRKRNHNEDAVMARPESGLYAVADGMGGHAAGDVASRMVTDALEALPAQDSLPSLVDGVEDAIVEMNERIREHAETNFGGRTMGCTVVALLTRGDVGVCLWAGDSRLYRLRAGELEQVSRDHSPLEQLVERGVMSPEEAEAHPDASVITRAVGGQPELALDIVMFDIEPGDTYLLCSDGLYREVDLAEITEMLGGEDVRSVARRLLEAALERGARDNVSVVVARCAAG